MKKIAITGSIASGKSTILNHFAKHFPVFNCDDAIKQIYQKPEIITKIKKKFSIEDFSKSIILNIIQQDSSKLKQLEAILYPELHQMMHKFEQKARRFSKIAYFEVPLLLEKNLTHKYDSIILVHSTKWKRKKNFTKRNIPERNIPENIFNFLNSMQWSESKKISAIKKIKKNFTLTSTLGKNIVYKNFDKCTHI